MQLSTRRAATMPNGRGKQAFRRRQIVAAIKPPSTSTSSPLDEPDEPTTSPSRRSLLLASTTSTIAAMTSPAAALAPLAATPSSASAATPAAATCNPSVAPLPPSVRASASLEIARARAAVLRAVDSASKPKDKNLNGYEAMSALHRRDPDLFHALLASDRATFAPLVYTPAVADACSSWGTLLTRPRGLYLSAADAKCAGGKGLRSVVDAWEVDRSVAPPRLAVVSDGHRILALGDLAAHGMGIPVGKCFLHSAGGGLSPSRCLPVLVDAGRGRDEREFESDPFYLGLRSPRLRGAPYDAFLSEAFEALRGRFGDDFIIHLEDFAGADAEALLERDEGRKATSFSDDIACTGAAAMGAVLSACSGVSGVPPLGEQVFLFFGAGQAAVGVARCAAAALAAPASEGGGGLRSVEEAKERIFMVDSKGLVVNKGRGGGGGRRPLKEEFARDADDPVVVRLNLNKRGKGGPSSLADVVEAVAPTALVGAAGVAGAFDPRALGALTRNRPRSFRPIVLALSNPTSYSECTPLEAAEATGGRAVFASGSPFPEFFYRGERRPAPSQANNALVFGGVGLGLVAADASSGLGGGEGGSLSTLSTLLPAARALAELAATADPLLSRDALVLPNVSDLPRATRAVAAAVALAVVEAGKAGSDCLPALKAAAAKLSEAREARGKASGGSETEASERLRREALREAEEAIAPLQFDGVAAFEASLSARRQ